MYEPRFYRNNISTDGLILFEVVEKETDLLIAADKNLSNKALELVRHYRGQIEDYILRNPVFLRSFVPVDISKNAPEIVKTMGEAAKLAGVGPMAAVAGAISEYVATDLLKFTKEIIIENGGDIYIKSNLERKVGIYAGGSSLSNKIGILIKPEDTPISVCTSSGTVGHSTSFGIADAVVIISKSAALADAVATRATNMVHKKDDIKKTIEEIQKISGVEGIIIIIGDSLGGWGRFEFVPI